MNFKPYVGVAGFMSSNEIMAAIETLPVRSTHSLAIGILTSAKTLRGELNRYPARYPKVDEIENILRPVLQTLDTDDSRVEFILHYAVEDIGNVKHEFEQLGKLAYDAKFDGVQINAPPHWIAETALQRALESEIGTKRVIMQVRPVREGEPFVDLVGQVLWAMEGKTTDILLDCSGGRGTELDIIWALDMIHSIRASRSLMSRHKVGIGVAGGLGPCKLGSVYGLLCNHGLLSFDVESGVRIPGHDTMSIAALQAYLREAWEMLARHPAP